MSMHKDEVNALLAELVNIKVDALRFDNGSEAAGRRSRVALMAIGKWCREIKNGMLATSRERRERKEATRWSA